MTAQQFIEFLKKSELLTSEKLQQALEDYAGFATDANKQSAETIAKFFVENGLMTSWHRDKLLAGKYRGFFLGKYKLLKHIGTGGMSSVYLAEHCLMKQQRAVKVLPRKKTSDPAYLERFYLEARATASLQHPNIVQAFDIDCADDTHFIVMEYVEGRDLNLIVKDSGPLSFELAANYIAQAALGLAHAHEKGLVHRDVKPGNLLVDPHNVVKILDLGLALFQIDDDSLSQTRDERVLGTADYLAPEQAQNSHVVDGRADLYSLGCSLYFLLTGHAPFPEGSIKERIQAHLHQTPESIRASRPECPNGLVDICQKMMQKKQEDRFQNAMDVATELDRWLIHNGYARVISPKAVRRLPQGARQGSGGGNGPLDEGSSSSARLLMGLTDSSGKRKADSKEERDPKTNPVNDSLEETLSGLSSLKESDAPDELPRIDVQASGSRVRRNQGQAASRSSQDNPKSTAATGEADSDSAARSRATKRSAVDRLRLPAEISLEGLAEMESRCAASESTGPQGNLAGGNGPPTLPPLKRAGAAKRSAAGNASSEGLPKWVWIALAGGGVLVAGLAILLGVLLSG